LTLRVFGFCFLVCSAIAAATPYAAFAAQQTPAAPVTQAPATTPAPKAAQKEPSKLISPDDGWFDISGFLGEKYGFVPIALPITEPAIGIGLAAGITFGYQFHK